MKHGALILLHLAILELSLKHLLGKETFLHLRLLQSQADLRLGSRGLHDGKPLLTGLLVGRGKDLHLIATLQQLADAHHAPIDAASCAQVTNLGMDVIGKVEHRSSHRELEQIATRGEDKHLVFVEIHLKLIHRIEAIGMLQHITNASKPLVKSGLALHALIAPVGCHTSFGYLVHPFGTYLHLYPLLLWSEHCDMKRLITVRLRYREPVAQTLGVGLIHIGHD